MPTATLVPITPQSSCWPQAVELYVSAFPEIERRSPEAWAKCFDTAELFTAYGIYDTETFCGFVCVWTFPGFTYVEHFAILPEHRGKGLGEQTVREIVRRSAPHPIVLEVEIPDTPLTRRRVGFYERSGLSLSTLPYMQPPYRSGDEDFPLSLMTSSADYLAANSNHVITTIHRYVYGKNS